MDDIENAQKIVRCQTKLPMKVAMHSVSIVEGKRIIISGGYSSQTGILSNVYEGTLDRDKVDVMWKQFPSLLRPRYNHTSFVMKNILSG